MQHPVDRKLSGVFDSIGVSKFYEKLLMQKKVNVEINENATGETFENFPTLGFWRANKWMSYNMINAKKFIPGFEIRKSIKWNRVVYPFQILAYT